MVAKTIKREEKTETVKGGLSKTLKENDTVEEDDFNIKNIVDQKEAANKINEIIKSGNKNTVRYWSIQGHILKKLKCSKGFVENVGISRSTIYFKIGLYKFLKKYLALKNSVYHRINLAIILRSSKQFVKATKNYLHRRGTVQMVLSITIVFNLFSLFFDFSRDTFYFLRETFYFSVRLFLFS